MEIKEEKDGEVLIVTVSDHLDSTTAGEFEAKLLALIESGERLIVVDCAPLRYLNSAGLKVFLIAAKRLEIAEGKLVLCALPPTVWTIFETIGFTRIMTIAPARDQALRLIRGETAPA